MSLTFLPPSPPIAVLLRLGSPSAIQLRIWSIIINSIKRQVGRAWTHVRKELFKRIAPLGAHRDPAASVVLIFTVLRVAASRLGLSPCGILTRVRHAMSFIWPHCLIARAALRYSPDQVTAKNDCFSAAIAGTKPLSVAMARSFIEHSKDGQLSKYQASQIFEIVWRFAILRFSHCVSYLRTMLVVRADSVLKHRVGSIAFEHEKAPLGRRIESTGD